MFSFFWRPHLCNAAFLALLKLLVAIWPTNHKLCLLNDGSNEM